MNPAKASLEENKAAILAALPKEFQADFEKQLADMSNIAPAAQLNGADAIPAIKAELKENPAVDESAAAAEIKDIKAPEVSTPETSAEK
ncbi:MAG: hypothetical protein JXR05_08075 [Flavobacteriaceae bacterium]